MSTRSVASLVSCAAIVGSLFACGTGGSSSNSTGLSGDGGVCSTVQLTTNCAPCMQASCSAESAAALGAGWASHDFSGGACSDLIDCYCACGTDRGCVDDCDGNRISAGCHDALQKLDDCTRTACTTQCAGGTLPDAGAG